MKMKEIGKMKINLNDGNWEVLKPKSKVNPKLNGVVKKKVKMPSLDELDGPTDEELEAIVSEEIIDKLLEDIELENHIWQMDLLN